MSNGCWEYSAAVTHNGYGRIKHNGKTIRAHRASWLVHFGPIPDGLNVLHKCDNPPCINPDHLFLGTTQENMDDKVAKGRTVSHLTKEDVLEVRNLYASGNMTQKEIGILFGVQPACISRIVNRIRWAK